jgi:hypothetical protein
MLNHIGYNEMVVHSYELLNVFHIFVFAGQNPWNSIRKPISKAIPDLYSVN